MADSRHQNGPAASRAIVRCRVARARPVKRFRDPKTHYVFPGAVKGTVISDATLRYLIADLGYKGLATTHGFRATFRTWASDTTTYEKGVIEAALAHAQGDSTAPITAAAISARERN